ncbi:MAG: DUF5906 domain-containing protein [Undibacterium sp.]|uniref:primase-helicase family protein n=1 Tax=Undibacterium sp. TaxID=1914977 RepID=UPI00271E3E60|nr:primase-helicase family protein [Undibacterium sp.]MDO8652023.1 DUF5906 domain-containing protein [Undibacterium sp.]
MTQALTLVTSDNTTPASASKPNIEDKAVIALFVRHLKDRGFCKLDSSSSNQTQIYNRFNDTSLPFTYIDNAFNSWLFKNGKKCTYRSTQYITYTLPHIVGSKFMPECGAYYTDPNSDCQYVNTYRQYKPSGEPTVMLSPLVHEFFNRLFPVPTECHQALQWLAHIFQHPKQRPSYHLMLSSDVGCGKGFLVNDMLQPLLLHTAVVNSYSKIMGKFSTVLEDSLLVLLDDPKSKSEDTQTQLKSLLSEERAYVERKGLQAGMVQTYTRFILASNEARPLHLESTERRWFVLTPLVHRVNATETQQFIQCLSDWLALSGSMDALYDFFMTYDLTGFNHKRIEQTETLKAMIGMSTNPDIEFIQHFVADHKVFTNLELMEAFKAEGMQPPSSKQVPHLLREVGLESSQKRIDDKLRRLIHPIGMSLDDIRTHYNPSDF